LEAVIRFFRDRDYEFISPDELVERLPNRKNKRKFVVFTFDDGYADNYLHAYPVFKKHDVPFTIYVTTSFPDREAILWWYILEDLLLEKDRIVIKTGSGEREFYCCSLNEKEETFRDIRSIIMNTSTNNYIETITGIFEPYGIDVYRKTSGLTLSWEQIALLSRDPLVTIGAHTVNHYDLSTLSPGEVKNEILVSKRSIESHLDKEVHHFAYPYGGREEAGKREFDLVKECRFKTAVTTRFASIFQVHKHHLECLPRIFIHAGADDHFLKQVVNGTLTGIANRFKRVVTV
jgi:peptidoglycan/xylan/chitin deacetylase (PgdA/CDA1 family)